MVFEVFVGWGIFGCGLGCGDLVVGLLSGVV